MASSSPAAMRLTSISSEVSEAAARASIAPVTVPERVNAIDTAKSPEFTSRQANRGERRFRDIFHPVAGTKATRDRSRHLMVAVMRSDPRWAHDASSSALPASAPEIDKDRPNFTLEPWAG